jgi:hypothetical protein
VNGDGVEDVVAAPGPGGPPVVKVYNGVDGSLLASFNAYEYSFTGGVNVAVGDLNGDGRADIVTTPDLGGGPRVRVFSGTDHAVLADFFGIDDPNFRGGARVSTGDVNHDGQADLVVAAGFGGGPRVSVFDGATVTTTRVKLTNDFFAFEPTLRNGVYVGVGDVDGDGYADLIFGGGPGGGPRVLAISGKDILTGVPTVLANFFAGDPNNRSGVQVGAADANGDGRAEITAVPVDPGAGTGGVYDLSGAALAGYRVPSGNAAGIPVKGTDAGTSGGGGGSASGGANANFNNTVVITNLKGTYTGQYQDTFQDSGGNDVQATVNVTLTIDSVTPAHPETDPETATNPVFSFTGQAGVNITGKASFSVPVVGAFSLTRFPTTFDSQTGVMAFQPADGATAEPYAGGGGTYDSGGIGGSGHVIHIDKGFTAHNGQYMTSSLSFDLKS